MKDEWDHDPSVRFMRRVFEHLELTQSRLLDRLNLSSFDPRLRQWREVTRDLFERAWTTAGRRGLVLSEEKAGILYVHCLAQTLSLSGIKIPAEAFPHDERISKVVKEVGT